MTTLIVDTEIIGKEKPVYFVGIYNVKTKEKIGLWHHKRGHIKQLEKMMLDPQYTWVSFNGNNFDMPLMCAAIQGADPVWLKEVASHIIENQMRSWETYRTFGIEFIELDHIDLIETAPGVMISLKTYIGRMGQKNMIDMPFEHDQDLKPKQYQTVEDYCFNDIEGTYGLFKELREELALRESLGQEYGIDLRSKSDAQAAEAILRSALNIRGRVEAQIPPYVTYTAPEFIQTKNPDLQELIERLESHKFKIDHKTGSPVLPEWLSEKTFDIGYGKYQVGIGGLHSAHDKSFYIEETKDMGVSDFDVASYYPTVMLSCRLVPRMQGNRGEKFLEVYESIYHKRLDAKKAGNKAVANSLKITINGTIGKLGNRYSAFYSPDLMLAVTITGQLNLLCLIDELERIKGVSVYSANTDGIMVGYNRAAREKVMKVFDKNSKRTSFIYEETPYKTVAMKDVNNYIAITTDGKAKRKGLYASNRKEENPLYLMKNPTMEVCANMAVEYLRDGKFDIKKHKNMRDFVAIRNVKGGGVQHTTTVEVDDWILDEDFGNKNNIWVRKEVKEKDYAWFEKGLFVRRKSKPSPILKGTGGTPFGRVARWYMTKEKLPAITYTSSGNKVPKTEGAKLCMTLPDKLPKDLDLNWYIEETYSMLRDMGVNA